MAGHLVRAGTRRHGYNITRAKRKAGAALRGSRLQRPRSSARSEIVFSCVGKQDANDVRAIATA